MITVLHRGGYAQMITILHRGEGSLGTPKSDYVICARPLTCTLARQIAGWKEFPLLILICIKSFFWETLITNVRFHKSYISPLIVHSQEVN